ncbi:hypothetical protein ACFC1R_28135 [Kitasatospora sp. NPDC056138]|uniref:hypothetical protein n=1 Tax=Kitasatospora sp. NPDC056138 TaxID=3345724 RepID=UPI0035DCACEB
MKFRNLMAAAGIAAALATVAAPAANAAPAKPADLPPGCQGGPVSDFWFDGGHQIDPGVGYCTSDGYELVQQYDGNLVIYSEHGAIWNTGTYGHNGAYTKFQTDGNLVVYASPNNPLWNSGTYGHPNARMDFKTGHVFIYDANGSWVWNS